MRIFSFKLVVFGGLLVGSVGCASLDEGLVGHWPLEVDGRDTSGLGNMGVAHGVSFEAGGGALFDGVDDFIEVEDSDSLRFGKGDFSVAVWVQTERELTDGLGDIASQYNAAKRRGFNFGMMNFAGVTSSQSNDRHVHFGIDSGAAEPVWTDCGRPGNAVLVYSMAVYAGNLYAGTCEPGAGEAGGVYRYAGGMRWESCGKPDTCNAVSSLAVHDGKLYAGVSKYRVGGSALSESPNTNLGGKVYRYDGGERWTFCGELPGVEAINGMAVFDGKLYASSMYSPGLYRYEGGTSWADCGNPGGKRVESLGVFNGHLYATGYDEGAIYRYDGGTDWTHLGRLGENMQTYSFMPHEGRLYVGTWRSGRVYRYAGESTWEDCGHLGEELEVMGMAAYNGKLYAGTLPLAQVYRYDGGQAWTLTGRLDHTPEVTYRRAWTMAVHQGRLYCGTLPSGHVWAMEAGRNVTVDHALKHGWTHLTAVRDGGRLKLYVDGRLAAESAAFPAGVDDVSTEGPLRIGIGGHDYFNGRMRDVRIYNRALSGGQARALFRAG